MKLSRELAQRRQDGLEVTLLWNQQILGVPAIVVREASPLRLLAQLFMSGHTRVADAAPPPAVHRNRRR